MDRVISGRDMVTQAIIDLQNAKLSRQELGLFKHRMDDETYQRRCQAADKRIRWREAMVRQLYKTRHISFRETPPLQQAVSETGSCVGMSAEEALEFADEWIKGMTFYPGLKGWRVVCAVLAETVREQRRGEYICGKCGLRQDQHIEKGNPQF